MIYVISKAKEDVQHEELQVGISLTLMMELPMNSVSGYDLLQWGVLSCKTFVIALCLLLILFGYSLHV